ncbi:MFS transporter [Derxia gummosa]|uniref:MFS transporter n=1 Tax=Derxia gummosa DSM 723 TaxID=1121388 RepID=A0A8B6X0V4_9BURK|nr:MFS transporter [Derxia gummosa]
MPPSPAGRHARRSLLAAFSATFLELDAWFMLLPLLTLTLGARGVSPTVIGLFNASMWAGILVSSLVAGRITPRLGARGCFWLSGVLPLVALGGFFASDSLWLWFPLYLMAGFGSGLRWIVSEALVAELSPPERRGRIVGLYQTMVGTTFIIGPALLGLTGAEGRLPLFVIGALLVASLVCAAALPSNVQTLANADAGSAPHLGDRHDASRPPGLLARLRAMPSLALAGFVGGVFESGTPGLMPLVGLHWHWTPEAAAMLVAINGVGGTLMMWPVGELADRLDHRRVSRVAVAALVLGSIALPFAGTISALAWAIVFCWGAAGGTLYTLNLLGAASVLEGAALVDGAALLVGAYTVGGMVAPALGGAAFDHFGVPGLAMLLAAIALGAGLPAIRASRRGHASARDSWLT